MRILGFVKGLKNVSEARGRNGWKDNQSISFPTYLEDITYPYPFIIVKKLTKEIITDISFRREN